MKDHLCNCLSDYKIKIESLKTDLDELSHNAELLRNQQRKMKHKSITISPSQTCDLCFKPVFDKEFYVFPCHHAFHRMCIQNKLDNYQTRDVGTKVAIEKLKSCFNQIDAIRDKAQLISNSDLGGRGSQIMDADKGGSYLNDITSGFSSLMAKTKEVIRDPHNNNPQSQSGRNMHEIFAMRQNDEKQIREKLKEIDEILTRECLFCGSMLIDMIDNDIDADYSEMFAEQDEGDDFAFKEAAEEDATAQIDDLLMASKNSEWAIE